MKLEREDGVTYLNREENEDEEVTSLEEAEALKERLLAMMKSITDAMGAPVSEDASPIVTPNIQEQINERIENLKEISGKHGGADRIRKQLEKELGNIRVKADARNQVVRISDEAEEKATIEKAERLKSIARKLNPPIRMVTAPLNNNIEKLKSIANMRMHKLNIKDSSIIKVMLLSVADSLQEEVDDLEIKLKVTVKELKRIKDDLEAVIKSAE